MRSDSAIPRQEANLLNITNGEYFNRHFLSQFDAIAVPFCESMMEGDTTSEIYSDAFVSLRSSQLGVSEEEYRLKMHVYTALKNGNYSKITLWFGKDTFCQMNLLTLLAYLEQISFEGSVSLNFIDDETFEVIERDIDVSLGYYNRLYREILIHKKKPKNTYVIVPQAIELYFDYFSREGKLSRLIKENLQLDRIALLCLVLENSKEYDYTIVNDSVDNAVSALEKILN